MKKGTELAGRITDMDARGRGVFMMNEKAFSSPFTVPGDEIKAEYRKRAKQYRIAQCTEILSPSKRRREARCSHANKCGGCLWQHMKYETQLDLKQMMINRVFRQHGHNTNIQSVIPAKREFFYRNRMDYAIGWKGEIGLHAFGNWNTYIDIKTCLLLEKDTPKILEALRQLIQELELQPWDNKFHRGNIKYIMIRRGEFTRERMITLIFHDLTIIDARMRKRIRHTFSPFCSTLYLGEQPTNTDTNFAKTLECIFGKTYLTEKINELSYNIHPNTFFQTNSVMATYLQEKVLALAKPTPDTKILDLYCGIGFFSIALAKKGAQITGIELVPESIELAKQNASLNHVSSRTTFRAEPAENSTWETDEFQTVIVDPSRSGLHPDLIQKLIQNPVKQLIYISCNYKRLAEELKQLKSTYALTQVEALDLFPQTPHVEVIASLKRKPRV